MQLGGGGGGGYGRKRLLLLLLFLWPTQLVQTLVGHPELPVLWDGVI